ncbi:MAG: amidohydrolase [Chloroflexi bacterium]|nr:amidohydrolase [Chloroflexota bacterium]
MLIDTHTHCFPPAFRERRDELLRRDATFAALYSSPKTKLATVEELLAAMDEAEIDVAVAVGIGWTDAKLAREANDYVAEALGRFSRRLVGFCGVNPAWGEEALREVERCAELGMRGIGELHPDTQGFRLDQRQVLAPLVEMARRLGLVILTHTSEPVGHQYAGKGTVTPQQAMGFVEAFPDVPLICAHWGGGLPFYALMPEVQDALKNTYFDSAASPLLYKAEVISTVTRLVGSDRVLFGSDFPLIKPQRLVTQVNSAGLTVEARAQFLGGNAARLLGLST